MTAIRYEQCYVACLDILGFKEKVMDSRNRAAILEVLLKTINICDTIPTGGKLVGLSGNERIIPVQSRFFSDTLGFFIKEKPENLPHMLLIIRYLQDRLWEQGICLRGGITVGEMYWPVDKGNITLGPGWIEAYKLESEIAIYPRIVVSPKLHGTLDGADAYPFGANAAPLKNYIRTDADGVHFLDLLHAGIVRPQDEQFNKSDWHFCLTWHSVEPSRLNTIRAAVQKTIDENLAEQPEDRVRQKYAWLQSYLNQSLGA